MPLVADIHFQPVVASMVADCFEKIRVNPGNFVDGRKRFDEKVYDDDSQFRQEQEHIREVPLHRQYVVLHAYDQYPEHTLCRMSSQMGTAIARCKIYRSANI